MDFFNAILWPIKWVIELILASWHWVFTQIGIPGESGLAWVLSILGLVLVVRGALIPLFVRQIRSQRKMLEIAPELKRIQSKYKGKRDQYSMQAQQREMSALYAKHGTSPFSSCLPILVQMPVFFGLFTVISHAANNPDQPGVGLMTAALNQQFASATIFGAPLSETFGNVAGGTGEPWQVLVLAPILVLIMIVSQFLTQLQIVSKNTTEAIKASPTYRMQRIMLYVFPLAFLFSGAFFPLGLVIYWVFSNLWTMTQQFIVIRNAPTPGTPAAAAKAERDARKLAKRGIEAEAEAEPEPPVRQQRSQPVSRNRSKKQQGRKS